MVHDFTRRNLSIPSDPLDAFTGLLTALEIVWDWRFMFAIPENVMDWALLWVPEDPVAVAASGKETLPLATKYLFPSWSWLSHPGASYYLLELHSNPLRSYVDWSSTVMWDGKRTRTLKDPRPAQKVDNQLGNDDPMITHYRNYPAGTMTIMGSMAQFKSLGRSTSSAAMDHFDTQRREFLVAGNVYTPLVNNEGEWYGTLVGITEDQIRSLLDHEETELSLFLLSSSQKTWVMGGFRRPIPSFDKTVFKDEKWSTVNVMLLMTGSRPYRRLAVGEVHGDEWEKMDPEGDLVWLA
jgi:hypothetical protein